MQEFQIEAIKELNSPKPAQEPYDFGKDIERELNHVDQQNYVLSQAPKLMSVQPSSKYGKDWNDALRVSNIQQKPAIASLAKIGNKKKKQVQNPQIQPQAHDTLERGMEL